jgi:hypothetical protein
MRSLEPLQLLHQLVEFGVADLGLAVDVVAFFVVANQAAEFCDSGSRVQNYRSREMT